MTWRRCAACGHRASESARFCERCGTALAPGATPLRPPSRLEAKIHEQRTGLEGERKQVTVMFTDVVGSMELTRALETERWGVVLDRFLAIAAGAVHAFEGTVSRFTGDGLMAIFGAPLAHEDHARRACLAVLELHRGVAALAAELARSDGAAFAVRCGLNSGEVVVGSIGDDLQMDFVPLGNTIGLGRRLQSLAPIASTAISAATAALVEGEFELRELGEFEVKGLEARQNVFELAGPGKAQTRLAAVAATRGLSGFVGRGAEQAQLQAALERALTGDGRAIGITGDAGVGKSRLVHEFAAGCAARGVTVIATGAVAHGRHATLLPVLAVYRDLFGIDERDPTEVARERIQTSLLALDPAFAPDLALLYEFLGVADGPPAQVDHEPRRRRLLELAARIVRARSRREALVFVVEDLQWLDDATAAYLESLAAAVTGTTALLVCTYRPEYGPSWTHDELALGPLAADATGELLGELLGADDSVGGLAKLIAERAAGNPFFVEELVQALADDGRLVGGRGDHRLAAELDSVVLPATIQAVLAARIDRLADREKTLLQVMSVVGQQIPRQLLREVCALDERELATALDALVRAQLVIQSSTAGEYAFKHPLTQEVAYRSQLHDRRARTHLAVAAALQRTYLDALDERAALLARHAEAADDMPAAARWHARAAAWAEVLSPADALHHWRRVRDLAGELEPGAGTDELAARARIGLLGVAWRLGMAPEDSDAIHAEGDQRADRPTLDVNYAATLMHSGRERDGLALFRDVSRRAVAAGDAAMAITPACGVSYAAWIAGCLREAIDVIDQAFELAGDDTTTGTGLAFVSPYAHAFGQRGQALGYMGELDAARADFDRGIELAREHGDPEVESYLYANLGLLEAIVGETAAARDASARGLKIAERAGNVIAIVATSTPGAVALAGAARFADALARAEENLATVRRQRMGMYYEPVLLATIARCQLALGMPDAALAAAEEAVAIMDARGLTACALLAPITLAQVLIATQVAAAGDRIEAVLARAARVARDSRAHVYETQIERELAALAGYVQRSNSAC